MAKRFLTQPTICLYSIVAVVLVSAVIKDLWLNRSKDSINFFTTAAISKCTKIQTVALN
jgi:hypothetical protein